MRYTLDNCNLYKILCERKVGVYKEYCGILNLIEQPVENLLCYIKANFPNYTDHSINHSFRILNYIYNIMSDELLQNMTGTEIFCLILSSFFHDIGMGNPDEKNKNKLRLEHGLFSEEPIRAFFKEVRLVDNIDRFVNCVVYVCKSHVKEIQEFYDETKLCKRDMINGEIVRYGYLAILLRVGDLLDMEEERTCYMVQKVFPSYLEIDNSMCHHKRHTEIENYIYTDKEINVEVKTNSRENYKIWSNWFSYLLNEILWANTKYFQKYVNVGLLPSFNYSLKPAENSLFSTEEIKFEIDDAGVLWQVISNSIYTREYDFLRELLQNAIDACILSCYMNVNNILENEYIRNWPIEKYKVCIMYSQKQGRMYIYDNGIGMDIDSLKNYLFKTADSGYKHIDSNRKFSFPAIAKFGIGFVSCLTKSENIKIYSQSENSKEAVMAEIEKNSSVAFLERGEKRRETGTLVSLLLTSKYTFTNINNYLSEYFLYQCIPVSLIDLDIFFSTANQDIEYDLNYNNFFRLKKYINEYQKKYVDYYEKSGLISKIIRNCIFLMDIIEKTEGDDIFPIVDILDYHSSLIGDLGLLKDLDKEYSFELKKYNQYSIELGKDTYLNLINEIKSNAISYNERLKKEFGTLKQICFSIGNVSKPVIFRDDIVIILLNDDLEVYKVSYEINIEDIKKNKGIIMIHSSGDEYESGIEYDCVSTFLFDSGEIVDIIAKIKMNENNSLEYDEKYMSFLNKDDLEYQIQDNFEEEIDESVYIANISGKDYCSHDYIMDAIYCDEDIRIVRGVKPNYFDTLRVDKSLSFFDNCSYAINWNSESIPRLGESVFTQDGIKLDVDISNLIPFKAHKFYMNLLGKARFELNITRHDINNDRVLIENWLNYYGVKIQKKVFNNVVKVFNQCCFEHVDWKILLKSKSTDFFSEHAYKIFSDLTNNYSI